MILLYLAVGGVLGTLARYAISGWVYAGAGTSFPWGTFVVNALGSLLLGFVLRVAELSPMSVEWRAFLTIGFCGAFTTFSTLSFEALALVQQGAWSRAALYSFGTLGIGLGAVIAGMILGTLLLRGG